MTGDRRLTSFDRGVATKVKQTGKLKTICTYCERYSAVVDEAQGRASAGVSSGVTKLM